MWTRTGISNEQELLGAFQYLQEMSRWWLLKTDWHRRTENFLSWVVPQTCVGSSWGIYCGNSTPDNGPWDPQGSSFLLSASLQRSFSKCQGQRWVWDCSLWDVQKFPLVWRLRITHTGVLHWAFSTSSSPKDFLLPITSWGDYSSAVDYFCQNLVHSFVKEFKSALDLKLLD